MKSVSRIRQTCRDKATAVAKTAARVRARKQAAFTLLDPQVQLVKSSTTAQIVTAAAIAGSILTGRLATAVTLTALWLGSRPVTHVIAGGVAIVGEIDAQLQVASANLQAMQAVSAEAPSEPQAERGAS